MDRVLFILALFALVSCDSPRRGRPVIVAGCVEGRVIGCVCSDGRMGSQVCLANDQYSVCECTGSLDGSVGGDGGEEEDGSVFEKDAASGDAGFEDSGFSEDSGFREDAAFSDAGSSDAGFDSGVDSGFDSGPRDTGAGDTDSGVRDVGTPDVGFPGTDGGLPDFDAGTGGPCSTDTECNSGLPFPILICELNVCEFGCLYYEFLGTPICVSPQVCDFLTGRCL